MKRFREMRLLKAIGLLKGKNSVQAQKIDILCNDMVCAHGNFIERLDELGYLCNFYESLAGGLAVGELLGRGARFLEREINYGEVFVFLLDSEGFEVYGRGGYVGNSLDGDGFGSMVDIELARSLSRCGNVCRIGDMNSMGFADIPTGAVSGDLFTVPLGGFGEGVGFVLVQNKGDRKFELRDAERAVLVSSAIWGAVKKIRVGSSG